MPAMWKRVISAAILIPIVGVVIYVGDLAVFALVLVISLLAGYEYLRMMREIHLTPSYMWGMLLILLFIVDAQWPAWRVWSWGLMLVTLGALTAEVFRGNAPGSLHRWSLVVSGGAYIGLAMGHFIKLRALERGLFWVALALLGTWICDSAAYFVGSAWGKRRFFPRISPKKTWEGAIGGLVVGTCAVALLGLWLLGLPLVAGVAVGVALCIGATFGDLAESVIKRQVGVKDSSTLIPGHGGFLDRIDSLLFVGPIVYYCAIAIGGGF